MTKKIRLTATIEWVPYLSDYDDNFKTVEDAMFYEKACLSKDLTELRDYFEGMDEEPVLLWEVIDDVL